MPGLVSEAGAFGAQAAYTVVHDVLADFNPRGLGRGRSPIDSTTRIRRRCWPGGSERGNEVMAQTAARLDLPMVANCIDVQADNGAGGNGL